MATEKPVSEPTEPEGTGVPADAAAEHTSSDSTPRADRAKAADATEIDKPDSSDSDDTEKFASNSASDTEPTGADETVKIEKAAAEPGAERAPAVALGEPAADAGASKTPAPRAAATSDKAGSDAAGGVVRPRFPLPLLAGAAVLLVAALVAVAVFFYLAGDRQDELDRRAAATAAACEFGNSFATYTGDQADDYLNRLEQNATGEWKRLVSDIGPELKTRFAETGVSSTASAVQCGYESGDEDNARIVLIIDQQFTTADISPEQGPGQVKVAADVDMQRIEGTWLVAAFDTPMMQQ